MLSSIVNEAKCSHNMPKVSFKGSNMSPEVPLGIVGHVGGPRPLTTLFFNRIRRRVGLRQAIRLHLKHFASNIGLLSQLETLESIEAGIPQQLCF